MSVLVGPYIGTWTSSPQELPSWILLPDQLEPEPQKRIPRSNCTDRGGMDAGLMLKPTCSPKSTLPQTIMEAYQAPFIEYSSLTNFRSRLHVNLEEEMSVAPCRTGSSTLWITSCHACSSFELLIDIPFLIPCGILFLIPVCILLLILSSSFFRLVGILLPVGWYPSFFVLSYLWILIFERRHSPSRAHQSTCRPMGLRLRSGLTAPLVVPCNWRSYISWTS